MGITTDPEDPRLIYGIDSEPVPQAETYLVLSQVEIEKGFVRQIRMSYRHTICGRITFIGVELAETWARDPKFYESTYCCYCMMHRYVNEFTWLDGTMLGT